jgi:hypothetical protein
VLLNLVPKQCCREYFIKVGTDSPENLLGYYEFDGTFDEGGGGPPTGLHRYDAHENDWETGDPTWKGGKGKRIIGAFNYLARKKGMNAVSFLTYNVGGDAKDVWPFTASSKRLFYDCSKLAQWEIVFEHADRLGIFLHFKTQETENDNGRHGLDGGKVGKERKLYYRELIARYSHHLALNWNLGEENSQTTIEQKEMSAYIADLDPYDHLIVLHTYPGQQSSIYGPLLGSKSELTGVSIQVNWDGVHQKVLEWLQKSANAGKKWVVANDEQGHHQDGIPPDDASSGPSRSKLRHKTLWGALMAGGCGIEAYFGYRHAHTDMNLEDWRSRENWWTYCNHAKTFFLEHIPFWQMVNADNLVSTNGQYCLADVGNVYAFYFPRDTSSGQRKLNLNGAKGKTFTVRWFDPRIGGDLVVGSVSTVSGGSVESLGDPPTELNNDWAVRVQWVDMVRSKPPPRIQPQIRTTSTTVTDTQTSATKTRTLVTTTKTSTAATETSTTASTRITSTITSTTWTVTSTLQTSTNVDMCVVATDDRANLQCDEGLVISNVVDATFESVYNLSTVCASTFIGECDSRNLAVDSLLSQCYGHRSCNLAIMLEKFGESCHKVVRKYTYIENEGCIELGAAANYTLSKTNRRCLEEERLPCANQDKHDPNLGICGKINVDECAEACSAVAECTHFSTKTGKQCVLCASEPSNSDTSLDSYVLLRPQPFSSNHLVAVSNSRAGVSTLDEAKAMCDHTANCTGFVWLSQHNKSYLTLVDVATLEDQNTQTKCFRRAVDTAFSNRSTLLIAQARCENLCQGVVCPTSVANQCHLAGSCTPETGECSQPFKAAETECDDGNDTTVHDVCSGEGQCVGQNLCTNHTCHGNACTTTECVPSTGACSNSFLFVGTDCNDENDATADDQCDGNGTCSGISNTRCPKSKAACTSVRGMRAVVSQP